MQGLENGLITSEYITGHAQMFSGKTMLARIEVKKNIISEVLDSFGMSTQFEHETEETVEAIVCTDELSLYYWLQMYSEFARRI